MASPTTDVFLSYKAEDRARLQLLVHALEEEGFSVWWDTHIGGGANWRRDIEQHLDAAKCVVVAWTKRSVGEEGDFVRDEAAFAKQRGIYLPIRFDAVELPLGFREVQALSLKGWKGDRLDPRFQAVVHAVRCHVSGEHLTRSHMGHSQAAFGEPRVSRRAAVAAGGVTAAAIVAVCAWELMKPTAASASGSIAVLPFSNLSGDPNQAYFSDGVAEEIRSALTRIKGLKVAGSTSSEAVRKDDAQTAAKKLRVANILTGSVRQSPSTIRVTAELIDGGSGIDKWSQDYDRPPGDAIKIQSDIAEKVAAALSGALGMAAKAAVGVGTQNAEAQRLFIEAGAVARRSFAKTDLQKALRLLDAAIALDSNYANAYALRSNVLTNYGNSFASGAHEIAANRAESLHLAQIALRIAPELADAHAALANVYGSNLQIAPMLSEQRRALQLAPGDADILATASKYTGAVGSPAEALALADRAIALDPLNQSAYDVRIFALFHARQFAEAIRYGQQLQQNSPTLFKNPGTIADGLVMLGRYKEAQSYYEKLPSDYWRRLAGEAIVAARLRDSTTVQEKLTKLQQVYSDAASDQFAEIYAQLGDKDRAFAALERGYVVKDPGLIAIRVDPFLDPIRSDPRLGALLRKMNFP